jgi:hypothetical protein
MKENGLGGRQVITNKPIDMNGVDVIELDCKDGDYFTVAGRGEKEYPVNNVIRALIAGQIKKEDITLVID